MNTSRTGIRHYWVAIRALLIFTVVLGVLYPLAITGIGQLVFPAQANGSWETADGTAEGTIVGSTLIGQSFSDAEGQPLPQWFQPRPSAATAQAGTGAASDTGYDGGASSGSNYGPENDTLIAAIAERRAQVAAFNRVAPETIPVDALTASASGLDPHISPEYALLQVERVAMARNLKITEVRDMVEKYSTGRAFGYLGEPTVNVLQLNVALERVKP